MWEYIPTEELYHHGVKGQKWGVRKKKKSQSSKSAKSKTNKGRKVALGLLAAIGGTTVAVAGGMAVSSMIYKTGYKHGGDSVRNAVKSARQTAARKAATTRFLNKSTVKTGSKAVSSYLKKGGSALVSKSTVGWDALSALM